MRFTKIMFFSIFIMVSGCQSRYAPDLIPKAGFYKTVENLSLSDAMLEYFDNVDAKYDARHGAYKIVYVSTSGSSSALPYGAFPYYEKSQVGSVFNDLCISRKGITQSDDPRPKMDVFYAYSTKLHCDNKDLKNKSTLEVTSKGGTLLLNLSSTFQSVESERKEARDEAIKKAEMERQSREEAIKKAEMERESNAKKCRSDTPHLRLTLKEGDYTLQGLVVEVKKDIALIQTQTDQKWFSRSLISSPYCSW